jgi:hypothetical protein
MARTGGSGPKVLDDEVDGVCDACFFEEDDDVGLRLLKTQAARFAYLSEHEKSRDHRDSDSRPRCDRGPIFGW